MTQDTLTVAGLLDRITTAVVAEVPSPVWVRGEVIGFKRTSGGAAFFRLVDTEVANRALEIAGRGRIMSDIDTTLREAGLGNLGDGVELRVRGTVGIDQRSSRVQMSLLEIDPAFTAGRLALDRARVLKVLTADGALVANRQHQIPLVPLQIGLVTSRGSAAHADFIDHLRRSPYRFSVRTAHTIVQGDNAPDAIAKSIISVSSENVDMVALVRGGGSKLDLAAFDSESIGRAIAASPVPIITGIGHEIDHTIADDAAAISEKTPTAASEWLVARVAEFADRTSRAREHIQIEARSALQRHLHLLSRTASDLTRLQGTLLRQQDSLDRLGREIGAASRLGLARHRSKVESYAQWFHAVGMEPTLRRGFALVTSTGGQEVIKSVDQVGAGDRLNIRFADGTVGVTVNEK